MNTGIFVTYNGTTLSPTPLINYSHAPVNFGYVYGYNTDISLDGIYSGITTTGAAVSYITGVFASQFGGLVVSDITGGILYSWTGVTVNSVTFDTNNYFSGSFLRYSIKLKSYDFPSGVIEPSNEYSFTQNDDGTVNVSHKISARGVRNQNGAFQNATNFVKQFTGQDPFYACLPLLVPSGSGVMLSIAENINRADSIYTVNEVYKYTTGLAAPYARTTSLNINDSIEAEFRTIDYRVKFQGSPVYKNAQSIINSYLQYGMLADIQTDFGFTTLNWVKNSYSADIDSGAATIEIKVGYSSGANASGYFDYDVSCDKNFLTNTEIWKVNGDFKCFGPLDYKLNQINLFKQTNAASGWRTYLTGIISSTPIYAATHDTSKLFSPNMTVDVTDNPELATLKLSLTMEAGYEPLGLADMKYSIEATPSRWLYDILPSATIEGAYVIQNLQTQSQSKQKLSLSCKTYNKTNALSLFSGYMNSLESTYVVSGGQNNVTSFVVEKEVNTGTYDVSFSKTWLGLDSGISSGLLTLQAVGTTSALVPLRPTGYGFGY